MIQIKYDDDDDDDMWWHVSISDVTKVHIN